MPFVTLIIIIAHIKLIGGGNYTISISRKDEDQYLGLVRYPVPLIIGDKFVFIDFLNLTIIRKFFEFYDENGIFITKIIDVDQLNLTLLDFSNYYFELIDYEI